MKTGLVIEMIKTTCKARSLKLRAAKAKRKDIEQYRNSSSDTNCRMNV